MLQPLDDVKAGMHVVARYNNLDMHLRVTQSENRDNITAEVMYFEPVLADKADTLAEGDEVVIDREHICWVEDE